LRQWIEYYRGIINHLWPPDEDEDDEMVDLVEVARQEWLAAQLFFNSVADPDLVDHAIYRIDAAEKKYLYLLRKARESGYRIGMRGDSNNVRG